jgi:cell wall assembly regulator SMI1
MSEAWTRIEGLLAERNVLPFLKLNPGASAAEIAAVEHHLGVTFPEEFRRLLLIHNGQDSGCGLFFGLQFLPLSEIKSNWDMWRSLDGDGLNEELADSMSSQPPGAIKPLYMNRGWVPFTHDYSGNHIGIDYDPDTQGIPGQIIAFGRDDDVKKLKADSFSHFLTTFERQLANLTWTITEKGWRVSDEGYNRHYHDWPKKP